MPTGFNNFSDDFYVNMDLHTALTMPQGRETVLQFCEAVQKQFPDMGDFYQREGGEYILEGDRQSGSYRWLELGSRRLSSGAFNPSDVEEAYRQHRWLLDRHRLRRPPGRQPARRPRRRKPGARPQLRAQPGHRHGR